MGPFCRTSRAFGYKNIQHTVRYTELCRRRGSRIFGGSRPYDAAEPFRLLSVMLSPQDERNLRALAPEHNHCMASLRAVSGAGRDCKINQPRCRSNDTILPAGPNREH
jgi:hypothetical protein